MKTPNKFKVNQIVFFKIGDLIQSGQIRFHRISKEDIFSQDGKELIMRAMVNHEYFISGAWYKESQLSESPESFIA